MNILGIETSCDETAAAVVRDGREILANVVSSQIELHSAYGGVVPELAAREHLRAMAPVVDTALRESGCAVDSIDAVAVTRGPGLVPALLVGVSYAKGLAAARGVPLIGINHFLAHIYGAFFESAEHLHAPASYPVLALVVSGGHTALVLINASGQTRIVGSTLDDAAGEAFDKAAKILNLGYPGGPIIDRLAKGGDPAAVAFPRPLTRGTGRSPSAENRFQFSFSGVKTALLYRVRDQRLSDGELADIVASYQAAIVDVLVRKTVDAADEFGASTVVMCGGVACNSLLRSEMRSKFDNRSCALIVTPPALCTDNAAMVAGLAFHYSNRDSNTGFDLPVAARLERDFEPLPFAPCVGHG